MKLVIGGATGFVGKELLKQVLANPEFTSVVTLGRRSVVAEDLKLTDVVLENFEHYSPSVIEKIADADACIWCVKPRNVFGNANHNKDNRCCSQQIEVDSLRGDEESHSRLYYGWYQGLVRVQQDRESPSLRLL